MKLNREDFKVMYQDGVAEWLVSDVIDELFDHIEALEAENKDIKEKLNIRGFTDDRADLMNRLTTAEAETIVANKKLSSYEDKKVAEFSGELYFYTGDDWLNNIENLVSAHLSIDKSYRVAIFKE